ncbi:MAG: hypothetical protein H0V01_10980 [Bacteroidetes bacterium]|nr:hypothetical protein [Bacteroidota bacterium]HET6244475.1 hypothetical protein [Bacteroidia bacterium]
METKKISRRIFSFLGILGIAAMVYSCEPSKRAADTTASVPITESVTPGNEGAAALDSRIQNLNQNFTNVEKEVMSSDKVSEEGFREEWRKVEVKRHELNRSIELYNQAIEKDASLEAAELRTDINRMITELERDLISVRDGDGMQQEPTQEPQFEQEQEIEQYPE